MLHATYLGHHGWLFSSGRAALLVDPLLHAGFGHTHAVELRAWPPRTLDFAEFPRIDAVFLTHEHEGHFDIASMALLDRRIPILISSRSSAALADFLREMGFAVRAVRPGVPVEVGDLLLHPITSDQVRRGVIDEWDALMFLVRDRDGGGSFFTNVDNAPTPDAWREARRAVDRPCVWSHTDNHSSWSFMRSWGAPTPDRLRRLVADIVREQEGLRGGWARPEAMLIFGGGFSFGGDRAWLDRLVFPHDASAAAAALATVFPGERILAPTPGFTLTMEGGTVASVEESSPFVRSRARTEWPERGAWDGRFRMTDYPPATGRTGFDPALEEELRAFAGHLYAGRLFRGLYSLTESDLRDRRPTFALVLRVEGGAHVYAYDPTACAFVPIRSQNPVEEFLAVFECWASDLLAYLRCEISPTTLGFGRSRSWNANPDAFSFDFNQALFEYVHPLRRPERFLALYRRTLVGLPPLEPALRPA